MKLTWEPNPGTHIRNAMGKAVTLMGYMPPEITELEVVFNGDRYTLTRRSTVRSLMTQYNTKQRKSYEED